MPLETIEQIKGMVHDSATSVRMQHGLQGALSIPAERWTIETAAGIENRKAGFGTAGELVFVVSGKYHGFYVFHKGKLKMKTHEAESPLVREVYQAIFPDANYDVQNS